ncbi:MAG: glycosyltransferase family 2 protein [Candidatus Adiutrix sp.]
MKSVNPLVSVIIPVYNRAKIVGRAIDSVLKQNYLALELLVVDDGSSDGFGANLGPNPPFRLLRQPNLGVSAARNLGIKAAKGKLIAFLDSDDEWLAGKIKAQVDYLNAHPHMVLVQTQERWVRHEKVVNPRRKHLKMAGDIFIPSLKLCLISPSAVMLRRSVFDEVGLFDENMLAAEDYDLWLRILAKHPAGLIDRQMVIRYGGHEDQLSARHSLDRYRIMALEKILTHPLSPQQKAAAEDELGRRRTIYLNGLAKRQA